MPFSQQAARERGWRGLLERMDEGRDVPAAPVRAGTTIWQTVIVFYGVVCNVSAAPSRGRGWGL